MSNGPLGFLSGGVVHACDEGRKNPFYAFGCTKDRSICPYCGQSVCSYHGPVNNAGRGGLLGSGAHSGRAFGGHSGCPGPDASKESLLGIEPVRLSWCTRAIDKESVPPEGKSLRLLIYNVGLLRWGTWANPPFTDERFAFLAHHLLKSGADVIAIQEIYEQSQVDELIEQVKGTYPYHARLSGREGTEVSPMKKFASGMKFHNGLMYLSRFPIEAEALHVHSHAAAVERMMGCKAMLVVKVLTPLGKLLLVNMHTTAGGTDPEGVDAVRQSELGEALMACEQGWGDGYRPLVIGDLNMGPEASPLNYSFMLEHGYKDIVVKAAPEGMDITTWDPQNPLNKIGPHAKSPPQRCDHMFAHPQANIVCTSVQRVFTEAFVPTHKEGLVTLSDHYGLLATLGPNEEETPPVVPRLLDVEWLRRTYAEEHGGAEVPGLEALVSYFVARDGPWGYGRLCADLLADPRTVEHNAATRHRLAQMSGAEKLLFMNFKSHNILEEARASKLFAILADVGADVVCLSEALVPNSVVDAGAGSLYELRGGAESLIVQPHPGPNIAECFREKKRADYAALGGEKSTAFPWEASLHGLGYRFLMFSNPQSCPFGSNWGNVMVFRSRPDACRSIDLAGRAEGKKGFGGSYDESRSAIVADVGGHRICVTHLEDKSEGLRAEQWKSIAQQAFGDSGETKGDRTLVGDINALDPESYSEEQWRILREAHFPPLKEDQDLPTAACKGLSEVFGARPSNRGQQFESLYQKCVSHGWSSRFKSASMLVTDATDFDHQPLVLTV